MIPLPYRSGKRQYKIWHGPKTGTHRKILRTFEIVDDYNGKDARKQVVNKYPDHSVGQPITINKLG